MASQRFGVVFEDLRWAVNLCQKLSAYAPCLLVPNSALAEIVLGFRNCEILIGSCTYSPGVAISLEDMKKRGVSRVLRLGTCGGYAPGMEIGDVVLCTGAIRGEGTSSCYVPESNFPAVAHLDATLPLHQALVASGHTFHCGIVWTTDGRIAGQYDPERIKRLSSLGVLGVEMESAAFFVVAQALGLQAGNTAVVVDLPLADAAYSAVPEQRYFDIDQGLSACLGALADALASWALDSERVLVTKAGVGRDLNSPTSETVKHISPC